MSKPKDRGFRARQRQRDRRGTEAVAKPTREIVQQRTSWSGPLPNPKDLQAYEEIVPGAADRIITMAEGFAEHQKQMEGRSLDAFASDRRQGRVFGTVVVLAAFGFAGTALLTGDSDIAMRVGGGVVVFLASVFVLGQIPDWLRFLLSKGSGREED